MKKTVKKSVAKAPAKKTVTKKPIMKAGGSTLKSVPAGNKGLSKLPTAVRNKMGYMKKGGPKKSLKRYQGDIGGSEVTTPTPSAAPTTPKQRTFADAYAANIAAGLKPNQAKKIAMRELGLKQAVDPNAVINAVGNTAGAIGSAVNAFRQPAASFSPFKKGGAKKTTTKKPMMKSGGAKKTTVRAKKK